MESAYICGKHTKIPPNQLSYPTPVHTKIIQCATDALEVHQICPLVPLNPRKPYLSVPVVLGAHHILPVFCSPSDQGSLTFLSL